MAAKAEEERKAKLAEKLAEKAAAERAAAEEAEEKKAHALKAQTANDVVAQVLNYTTFGKDDGDERSDSFWYKEEEGKCRYRLYERTISSSSFGGLRQIDLNSYDQRNIKVAVTSAALGPATIIQYEGKTILLTYATVDVDRLNRGWSLIFSNYCKGTKTILTR
jgi:hypothetical protein